jgi:hypothetical protein
MFQDEMTVFLLFNTWAGRLHTQVYHFLQTSTLIASKTDGRRATLTSYNHRFEHIR